MPMRKEHVKLTYSFSLDKDVSDKIDAIADVFGSSRSYVIGVCINAMYRMVGADRDKRNLVKLLDIKLNPEGAENLLRNATAK